MLIAPLDHQRCDCNLEVIAKRVRIRRNWFRSQGLKALLGMNVLARGAIGIAVSAMAIYVMVLIFSCPTSANVVAVDLAIFFFISFAVIVGFLLIFFDLSFLKNLRFIILFVFAVDFYFIIQFYLLLIESNGFGLVWFLVFCGLGYVGTQRAGALLAGQLNDQQDVRNTGLKLFGASWMSVIGFLFPAVGYVFCI